MTNTSKKNMVFKVFLDINIVIDLYDESRPGYNNAVQIFNLAESNKVEVFISETVLTTTAYVLRKHVNNAVLREIITGLNEIFNVLPCDNRTITKALESNIKDIEDAILYETAKHYKLHYFITNDKNDFKNTGADLLPVLTSEKFLALLEQKK